MIVLLVIAISIVSFFGGFLLFYVVSHKFSRGIQMGLKFLGSDDLGGMGKTQQLMTHKGYLYVGNMVPGIGIAIIDVTNPRSPRVIGSLPGFKNSVTSKVQIANELLIVNYESRLNQEAERVGFGVYSLKDPKNPREIAHFNTRGRGVHRTWFSGEEPYVFVSAIPEGFTDRMLMIVDINNPSKPQEVAKWWLPGQWLAGGEVPSWPVDMKYCLHHAIVKGNRAYLGMWDAGMYILDISDIANPREISHVRWSPENGGRTHTALPLLDRNLLVVTDEAKYTPDKESPKDIRILDISDEKNPKVLSKFPKPTGDIRERGPRFGPHNLHENRPGSFISDKLIFATQFSGGIWVYDISDSYSPKEVAGLIPPTDLCEEPIQINDVFVQKDGLVFLSDRSGRGIYILEYNG